MPIQEWHKVKRYRRKQDGSRNKNLLCNGSQRYSGGKKGLVEEALRREVAAAIEDGYTRFISGFAEGADLMFAAIVAEAKKENDSLFLEAAIPYAGRLKTKDKEFHRLLTACDGVKVISDHYVPSCYMKRNRYMVAQSQRVIAVYDGREKGGTLFTMRAAHVQKREIRVIEI